MARHTWTNGAEDQRPDHSAASIRSHEQTQVKCLAVYLFYKYRLHDSAKDSIQKVRCHDHEHDGQNKLIVVDEAQARAQFIEVLSTVFLLFMIHGLVGFDRYGN